MSRIYLDHHATTPVDPRVLDMMLPWFGERFGNASSRSHDFGTEAAEAVHAARHTLANCLGCKPEELIFTSGATEANNLAIKGTLLAAGVGSHAIVNQAEHRAVLDPAKRMQRSGCELTNLPVDAAGEVDPDQILSALRPETRLVSVMLANNEVGTINRVEEIATACRERGVAVHSDAAQAFGHIPLDLSRLPVDLLSLTAHKLYGPQGIGALFVRRREPRLPLVSLIDGGGHERGLRSGTLPVALVVGFAEAAKLSLESLSEESARIAALRDELQRRLLASIDGLRVNGHPERRLPGNLNVTIPNVDGDALMARLQRSDLAISSGAACSSAAPEPSRVLRAMGLTDSEARASIRFGLGRGTRRDGAERAVAIVVEAVNSLRLKESPNSGSEPKTS